MEVKWIYEGIKLVGLRDHIGQWWKVTQDCVQCGKCCKDVPLTWMLGRDKHGACKYLEEYGDQPGVYFCSLGSYRPFGCCGNSPFSTVEYCSVRFEKIDDPSSLL